MIPNIYLIIIAVILLVIVYAYRKEGFSSRFHTVDCVQTCMNAPPHSGCFSKCDKNNMNICNKACAGNSNCFETCIFSD